MGRICDFQERWHHVMNGEAWDKVNDTKWRNNVASGHQRQRRSGSHDLGGAKHTKCTGQKQIIAPGSHQRKLKWRRGKNTLGRPQGPRPAGLAPIYAL